MLKWLNTYIYFFGAVYNRNQQNGPLLFSEFLVSVNYLDNSINFLEIIVKYLYNDIIVSYFNIIVNYLYI